MRDERRGLSGAGRPACGPPAARAAPSPARRRARRWTDERRAPPRRTNAKRRAKAKGPSKNRLSAQQKAEQAVEAAEAALRALEAELADPAAWATRYESAKSEARHTAATRAVEEAYARLEALSTEPSAGANSGCERMLKTARNVAIVVAIAAAVYFIPGGGARASTFEAALWVAFGVGHRLSRAAPVSRTPHRAARARRPPPRAALRRGRLGPVVVRSRMWYALQVAAASSCMWTDGPVWASSSGSCWSGSSCTALIAVYRHARTY